MDNDQPQPKWVLDDSEKDEQVALEAWIRMFESTNPGRGPVTGGEQMIWLSGFRVGHSAIVRQNPKKMTAHVIRVNDGVLDVVVGSDEDAKKCLEFYKAKYEARPDFDKTWDAPHWFIDKFDVVI